MVSSMKNRLNALHAREILIQLALQPHRLAQWMNRWMPETPSSGQTVMSLDGQWLKLLQMQGPSHARRITKWFVCPVKGASLEEMVRVFQETCTTEGVIPKEILVAIPAHLCTVRFFSLPSTNWKEIRDIVELQAEKHTPYAREEILTDFVVLDRERSGYSRVLLIIAHQDIVGRPVRLVELSQLPLERVSCELEGLVSWFRMVKKESGKSAATDMSLVVEIDSSTTTLLLMQHSQPTFHRSLVTGAEHLEADPTQAGERFIGELQRSLEAIDAESSASKAKEILLTGRIERLAELKVRIEKEMALPVYLIPPWASIEMPDTVRQAYERLADVSFASLVGLATAPSQIDLTPQATKLRQAFESRAKTLVLLGCQCIAALILVSLLIIGRAHKQYRYYEALRAVYQQSAEQAFAVEETFHQLGFVEGRLRHRGQLLEAVSLLAQDSSEGIQWRSLTFTPDDGIVLKGISRELPQVYEFVATLDTAPIFGQVEAKRVAKRKSGDQDVADFEIRCPLISDGTLP